MTYLVMNFRIHRDFDHPNDLLSVIGSIAIRLSSPVEIVKEHTIKRERNRL